MKKKRSETQGKARRRPAKDLTTRKGGGVKAAGGVRLQDVQVSKLSDVSVRP